MGVKWLFSGSSVARIRVVYVHHLPRWFEKIIGAFDYLGQRN